MKLVLLAAAAVLSVAAGQWVECPDASACSPDCKLENNCQCSSTKGPTVGGKVPQIVYLSYDDGFTALAEKDYYRGLFDGSFTNPDGCPVRATHFLTQENTDYSLVNEYYQMGHEMAIHSMTHRNNLTYWQVNDVAGWTEEMVGMRQAVSQFANIPQEELVGIRVPFLQTGAEQQFTMMKNEGFEYDCSMATRAFGYTDADRGMWPYTLDYKSDMDCVQSGWNFWWCPKCSYEGIWVQPMIDLEDMWVVPSLGPQGQPCAMLDSCIGYTTNTPEEVEEMLMKNWDRVYNGNRAPWGLYVHSGWFFQGDWHYQGYKNFLTYISSLDDVWIVPIKEGLEYVKSPVSNEELLAANGTSVFGCDKFQVPDPARDCGRAMNCRYNDLEFPVDNLYGERNMKICTSTLDGELQSCPERYPWLGDPCGGNC